jgi:hypothetical protein
MSEPKITDAQAAQIADLVHPAVEDILGFKANVVLFIEHEAGVSIVGAFKDADLHTRAAAAKTQAVSSVGGSPIPAR